MSSDVLNALLAERGAYARIVKFYECLDRGDAQACSWSFTDTGVWERDGKTLTGRAAVQDAIASRAPTRRTMHTVLNFQFAQESEQRGVASFILVAYDAKIEASQEVPTGRVAGIRLCADTLEKGDDGWLIARKTSQPYMRG